MNLVKEISKCKINIDKPIYLLEYEELNPKLLLIEGYRVNTYKIYTDDNSLEVIDNLYSKYFTAKEAAKKISNIKKIDINYYNKMYIDRLRQSKKFLLSKFKLHDIYTINNGIIKTSPFNINISRLNGKTIGGYLETSFNEVYDNNYEVLFSKIHLPLLLTKMLPAIYSHEIIHTQIMSQIGSIDNFFNNDVLPIFIELLYQYENNFYSTIRINHLHISSSFIDKDCQFNISTFNDMLYYVSIVTAYKLLDIYIKGNIFIKKEILNNIQSVFDSKFTVEELLNKYDLDWTKKRVIL